MRKVLVNGRWPLQLLEHRAARPEWPMWEAHTLSMAAEIIKPGSMVWDVGAEEGDFPALWGSWGAEVVLIEPNPNVWPQIKLHWEANVSHKPAGYVTDLASSETTEGAGARLRWPDAVEGPINPEHGFYHLAEHTGVVPQARLDDLELPNPDVVMMDIEGGEWQALQGMTDTMRVAGPTMLISIHPPVLREWYGTKSEVVVQYVEDHGYKSRLYCYDHEEHWVFWKGDLFGWA